MEIREIFENKIKIEPKVISIESLFMNEDRVANTNYKPSYQRNYVWDDEKATYFIESILLGTEIPPLIYFRNADKVEVIDGRQRYQTILRFINNEFKLKKNGLQKLENIGIANKSFKDIDFQLQDLFWETKLRLIEFSFHSHQDIDEEIEEVVKKEIFKRYNSGITPLKPTEIDNAVYFEDDLNSYIKERLQKDKILLREISSLLHFEKSNNEIILKKIRQLLVQHQIPIKYYAVKKDNIISRYYEFLFSTINEADTVTVFNSFLAKINLINRIKKAFPDKAINYNRLITECLFWSFSILEEEKIILKDLDDDFIKNLVVYISNNIDAYGMDRSSFAKELYNRYFVTSEFFSARFNIDFSIYLQYNQDFKQKNKEISPINEDRISFDDLRINKPEPSSIAIMDITRRMGRQRFLIRPPYQRNEVINKKKSSSIIESILLGIKLPPIFVYNNENGVSEVLDGQQRLLSILGFIQETYLDEHNKTTRSDKDGFSLNLKNGILSNLNGKKFDQLSADQKYKIKNFDLWIIEINYKNNVNFEPIDLFIRLNNKPYPIKEDTFEMWNSYISRDLIETIKSIHRNHKDWFYIRKNNSRMEDENIYTTLSYFQFSWNQKNKPKVYAPKDLDIYKVVNKVNFRVKSKNEITKVLESAECKEAFIQGANEFEFNFIRKIKSLISDGHDLTITTLNKNLDDIFLIENGRRTQQSFYALWYFLYDVPISVISKNKIEIRKELKKLYAAMSDTESKQAFDHKVEKFKSLYSNETEELKKLSALNGFDDVALLGEICTVTLGTNIIQQNKIQNIPHKILWPFLRKGDYPNKLISTDDLTYIDSNEKIIGKDTVDNRPKLLIKRNLLSQIRLSIYYFDGRLVFNGDFIGVTASRYGFSTKYLYSILTSRYIFNKFLIGRLLRTSEDSKLLSLSELKNIPIPYIGSYEQSSFNVIWDYLMFSSKHISLFFERLLDGMVYELYFSASLAQANIQFIKHIENVPLINNLSGIEREHSIENVYRQFSDPGHEISSSFLKLLNISEVQQLEEPI